MGDMSAEPSMEEILSSIKRIIAEEGDAPTRGRRPVRGAAAAVRDGDDEVLELSDPMPSMAPDPVRVADSAPVSIRKVAAPAPVAEPSPSEPVAAKPASIRPTASEPPVPDQAKPEPIVSPETAEASRGSLEALSRLLVKPEPNGDGTLEGLVREMLRPMLREWLDANLPPLVETMVSREIAKIGVER